MKNPISFSALAVTALLLSAPGVRADKAPKPFRAGMAKVPAAKAVTAVFAVSKMHCEGCASGLVQAAKGWQGVKSADVSFTQKRALVTFDPKKTNTARIAKEFTRIGFPAKVVH